MKQQCRKCGRLKDVAEFEMRSSGNRARKCKTCTSAAAKARRKRNAMHYQAYERIRQRDPARRRDMVRNIQTTRKRHPEKYHCWNLTAAALRSGRLKRQPCEVCGALEVEAHHEDYSKPYEVRWLCPEHHRAIKWG